VLLKAKKFSSFERNLENNMNPTVNFVFEFEFSTAGITIGYRLLSATSRWTSVGKQLLNTF